MRARALLAVPWFLWSTVYPGGGYFEKDIRSQPVKEYASEKECETGMRAYQIEVDKAFPLPKGTSSWGSSIVMLKCSPVYPR